MLVTLAPGRTPREVCTAIACTVASCVLRAVVQFVQQKPEVVVLLPYAW